MKTWMFSHKATGELDIDVWHRLLGQDLRTVTLTVRRRDGAPGRCIIEFPVSEIPEIIKELQKVYDEN